MVLCTVTTSGVPFLSFLFQVVEVFRMLLKFEKKKKKRNCSCKCKSLVARLFLPNLPYFSHSAGLMENYPMTRFDPVKDTSIIWGPIIQWTKELLEEEYIELSFSIISYPLKSCWNPNIHWTNIPSSSSSSSSSSSPVMHRWSSTTYALLHEHWRSSRSFSGVVLLFWRDFLLTKSWKEELIFLKQY